MLKVIILSTLTALQTCFIFLNSLFSRPESLQQSDVVRKALQTGANIVTSPFNLQIEITEHFTRKLAHFTEFFILGILVFALLIVIIAKLNTAKINHPTLIAMTLAIGVCVTVGTCDELLQFVSGRAPMVQDVILDSIGGACGVLVALGIKQIFNIKE